MAGYGYGRIRMHPTFSDNAFMPHSAVRRHHADHAPNYDRDPTLPKAIAVLTALVVTLAAGVALIVRGLM